MHDKTFAFVTGCARSGTTALTALLNRHPHVAIGFERFSYIAAMRKLEPALFEAERFRRFEHNDTQHKSYNDPMRRAVLDKIAEARVVGDKLPRLIGRFDQLDRFPNWRIVFILREPMAVARSFEMRVRKVREKGGLWPTDRGYERAVVEFNDALRDAGWLSQTHPERFHLVNFYELFVRRAGVDDLFHFLGVDPSLTSPLEDIFARTDRLIEEGSIDPISLAVSRGVKFHDYQMLFKSASNFDQSSPERSRWRGR